MIRYLIYVNHEKTQEGELSPGEHIAGRSHSADIHLTEPDVSGKHLKLDVTAEGIFAEVVFQEDGKEEQVLMATGRKQYLKNALSGEEGAFFLRVLPFLKLEQFNFEKGKTSRSY